MSAASKIVKKHRYRSLVKAVEVIRREIPLDSSYLSRHQRQSACYALDTVLQFLAMVRLDEGERQRFEPIAKSMEELRQSTSNLKHIKLEWRSRLLELVHSAYKCVAVKGVDDDLRRQYLDKLKRAEAQDSKDIADHLETLCLSSSLPPEVLSVLSDVGTYVLHGSKEVWVTEQDLARVSERLKQLDHAWTVGVVSDVRYLLSSVEAPLCGPGGTQPHAHSSAKPIEVQHCRPRVCHNADG